MELSLCTKGSFEEVLRLYSDMVYRLAFSRVKNSHDANDITQDVFLKYIRAEKTYNDEEHRKAWLIKTTLNTSKTLLLSSWNRRRSSAEFTDEGFGAGVSGAGVSGTGAGEDKSLKNIETKSVVLSAVMKLPKKYRTAIHLFYYEDMPLSEISAATGLSLNTVKSQLHRARLLLKDDLAKEGVEFNDIS
ncbi:MAG: sigma-70 family RNA polymerase sigma factor [Oscillospiraceae bacterium]|nr:sigma-70 family RNA polymerase sigma factor [Oscillospiraceae bacterium]